jgi:hypothetical protein
MVTIRVIALVTALLGASSAVAEQSSAYSYVSCDIIESNGQPKNTIYKIGRTSVWRWFNGNFDDEFCGTSYNVTCNITPTFVEMVMVFDVSRDPSVPRDASGRAIGRGITTIDRRTGVLTERVTASHVQQGPTRTGQCRPVENPETAAPMF